MLRSANTTGLTPAYMRDNVDIRAGTLTVKAGDDGNRVEYQATATGFVFAIAIGGGAGVTPTANANGTIEAFLGAPADVAGVNTDATKVLVTGAIVVEAYSDLHATSEAKGTAVAAFSV